MLFLIRHLLSPLRLSLLSYVFCGLFFSQKRFMHLQLIPAQSVTKGTSSETRQLIMPRTRQCGRAVIHSLETWQCFGWGRLNTIGVGTMSEIQGRYTMFYPVPCIWVNMITQEVFLGVVEVGLRQDGRIEEEGDGWTQEMVFFVGFFQRGQGRAQIQAIILGP